MKLDGKESKITEYICAADAAILKLLEKIDAIKGRAPEIIVMVMYSILHFVVSYFHEPWFDEAEAWQISRCASFEELFFEIPHLEGHTPMWDFILMPFSRLGAPYELSLSLISFIFIGSAVTLVIWKSPFPRLLRLLLPFTYFFFYQYGVITRPYCVITFLMILMAYLYSTKNEKPVRFIICLALLAYIHAYGLLIAGGVTIVWIIDIWNKRHFGIFVKEFVRDKRAWLMLGLLVFAILTILQILPWDNTYATDLAKISVVENGVVKRGLYTFLILPLDASVLDLWNDYFSLAGTHFNIAEFIYGCIFGVAMWGLMLWYGHKKHSTLLLVIPYAFLAGFSAITYISMHHIGVGLIYIICWLWMSEACDENEKEINDGNKRVVLSLYRLILAFIMLISVYWSVAASVTDISYDYVGGRREAKFIREAGLDKYRIMAEWETMYHESNDEIALYDFNGCYYACVAAPYFDHNIFYNVGYGKDEKAFVKHITNTESENEAIIDYLKNNKPEIIYGEPELSIIYSDEELNLDRDYSEIYHEYSLRAWKSRRGFADMKIYARNDILQELVY